MRVLRHEARRLSPKTQPKRAPHRTAAPWPARQPATPQTHPNTSPTHGVAHRPERDCARRQKPRIPGEPTNPPPNLTQSIASSAAPPLLSRPVLVLAVSIPPPPPRPPTPSVPAAPRRAVRDPIHHANSPSRPVSFSSHLASSSPRAAPALDPCARHGLGPTGPPGPFPRPAQP